MQPAVLTPARASYSLGQTVTWPVALAIVVAGSILLALSSKLSVPFLPVPMTMQPLAILLIGMMGGVRIGMATVALYLAEGACGLPVFSGTPEKGVGLAYMVGPTGGYLAGFLLSVGVTGALADRGLTRSIVASLGVAVVGLACIYGPGAAWLAQFVGLEKAFTIGVMPFLLGDALKVVVAALAVPTVSSFFDSTAE
jgi:biotin transport system substrate-specific component